MTILSTSIVSESRAEIISCINGKYADGTDCEKCGDNCNWSFDTTSGKLSISGSGKMNDYEGDLDSENKKYVSNTPWNSYKRNIKSVDVQGVENIGKRAFYGTSQTLREATIADSVTSIGQAAFYSANIESIILPESLTYLSVSAFEHSGLTSVAIPDSVNSMDGRVFAYNNNFRSVIIPDSLTITDIQSWGVFSQNYDTVQIICKGDEKSCKSLENRLEVIGYNLNNFSYANSEQCNGSYIYENGVCHKRNENQCNDTENYYYNGSNCVYRPSEKLSVSAIIIKKTTDIAIAFAILPPRRRLS